MSNIIKNNSDILFLYEAINCNPNGDPDQENKPRMDYDTKTNLVTDVRVKRTLRDYLKNNECEIFVDMEGDSKVSPETKLKAVIARSLENKDFLKKVFKEKEDYLDVYNKIFEDKKNDTNQVLAEITKKDFKHKEANFYLLEYLIKEKFVDIRMFGGAFAVAGFTHAYTGAIQLNWGYSLNKVELMESNSIVTIMNDDNSTFGKDYRLYYSLLAFNGTINKNAALTTGLTDTDLTTFRDGLWKSVSAMPTRSKLNQYPKLYVEIIYNEGYYNGYFGDLRQYISIEPVSDIEEKQIRSFKDIILKTDKLKELIENNKGEKKPIKEFYIQEADGVSINLQNNKNQNE